MCAKWHPIRCNILAFTRNWMVCDFFTPLCTYYTKCRLEFAVVYRLNVHLRYLALRLRVEIFRLLSRDMLKNISPQGAYWRFYGTTYVASNKSPVFTCHRRCKLHSSQAVHKPLRFPRIGNDGEEEPHGGVGHLAQEDAHSTENDLHLRFPARFAIGRLLHLLRTHTRWHVCACGGRLHNE